MTRKWPASSVDRSLAGNYLEKAIKFKADAEKMMALGDEFSGNGISVLCVHAAIAYADAIAIFAAGRKSKSGDHRDATPFLASVIPIRNTEDKAAMRSFEVILSRKDEVSYLQDLLSQQEAAALLDKLRAFARWRRRPFGLCNKGHDELLSRRRTAASGSPERQCAS